MKHIHSLYCFFSIAHIISRKPGVVEVFLAAISKDGDLGDTNAIDKWRLIHQASMLPSCPVANGRVLTLYINKLNVASPR